MSNGIASHLSLLIVACALVFTGCAGDPVTQTRKNTHGHGSVAMTQAPAPANDSRVIGNKFCPVMGEPLGSMGKPVPVTVDGETLFVCCRGCVKKVKADPAKYFAIARNE